MTEQTPARTPQRRQVGGGRKSIGDVAPKLAELTDDVLFDDVWNRPGLAVRDRSLVTVAVLVAGTTSTSCASTSTTPARTA